MAYHHSVSTYHRSKRARKIKKYTTLLILLIVVGVGAIGIDWVIGRINESSTISIESSASVQSSSINIFRTPYFQFQADKTWREVETAGRQDGRYVYRSYNDFLVRHELIVEVNRSVDVTLDNVQSSRVLPVTIKGNFLSAVGGISPHCKDIINDVNNREQQFVKYKEVTFPCDPDSGQFVVLVGLVNGKHYIEKKADDGIRTYKIIYRDSTFSPAGRPLVNIINSFQLL